MIAVSEERAVDFESTAGIATEAFGSKDVAFSASRMKWLYERGFGEGAAVVSAFDGDKKVGQIVLLHQKVHLDGAPVSATQLIDLFVLKAYRSPGRGSSTTSTRRAERLCEAGQFRIILGLPNPISAPLNARFMKVSPFLSLPVRIGVSLGWPRGRRLLFSIPVRTMSRDEAIERLAPFATPASENGLYWDAKTLFERISDPTCAYAVHATADLLLVSSSRRTRGISHALLCGFFARPGAGNKFGRCDRHPDPRRLPGLEASGFCLCRCQQQPAAVAGICNTGAVSPADPGAIARQVDRNVPALRSLSTDRFRFHLVSRFRSSYPLAAPPLRTSESKGHQQTY